MSSNIRVNSITPSVGNSVAIGTAGGSVVFQCDTINFSGTSGVTNFTKDISVDGHTELDNVNISGVVTATSFVGPLTGNVTGNVSGNLTGNVTGNADTASNLTGSPSISVTNITASGNVSVAGTLTYEDVTNIDSVGIITARSGINVTDGTIGIGTDDPSSNALVEIQGGAGGKNTRLLFNSKPVKTTGSIGEIFFRNNDDSVAYIICGHDGVNDAGNLSFATQVTGGSLTEKLRITSDGDVGISSTAPKTDVDISQKTGAVALPQGTTAQRPTGSAPYIRKNTTNNALEFYNGTEWVEIITDYFPTGSITLS